MNARSLAFTVVASLVLVSLGWGVPRLMERQRSTEAIRELARLSRSASVYYVKPKPGEDGARMLCQFPPGQIRTTLAKSCCDPSVSDGQGQCDPAKIEWNRTLWSALRWKLDEPHTYVYEYEAAGKLGEARFTLSAYGDVDCDGEFSTFRFVGRGDPKSSATECILTEAAQFEAIQPDE